MHDLPTCILADDHALIRDAMRIRLEDLELMEVVGESSHCAGAAELIRMLRPTLALVDLRMPGGGGLQLVEDLRTEGCETMLVVFSACRDAAMVSAARTVGADAYIAKDLGASAFAEALALVLAGSGFVCAIAEHGDSQGRLVS